MTRYGPLGVEHTRKEKKQRQRQAIAPEQRPVEVQTQGGKNASNDPTLTNVRSVRPLDSQLCGG